MQKLNSGLVCLQNSVEIFVLGPHMHVYQYLSMCLDRPVKKAIVDLPMRLKGSSKHVLLVIVESVSGLSAMQASRTPEP